VGGLLENLDDQRLIRHPLLQIPVPLVHLPQLLGQQRIHRAALRPPPMVRLPDDVHLLADLGHRKPFAQVHVRPASPEHNPLRIVSLLQKGSPFRPTGRMDSPAIPGSDFLEGVTLTVESITIQGD